MLPLSLLKTAQGHPMLVELKNGETYNGHLVSCDTWMNIHLREVICTSKDGDRFWRMPQCYVRGNTIKYLRVPDEVIDKVQEEVIRRQVMQCCHAMLSCHTVMPCCHAMLAASPLYPPRFRTPSLPTPFAPCPPTLATPLYL
ncbi:unnamed protein product [Closterium sp. Naga37s-1]|nr:unnamed protein product [Closterium sp. Naga37s-1]